MMRRPKSSSATASNIPRLFRLLIAVYAFFLILIGTIACYYVYREKKTQLLSSLDLGLSHISDEYSDILDNFWQSYLPIYESDSSARGLFQIYFSQEQAQDLTPLEKKELVDVLAQMKGRDSRIQWIALYSENRAVNYLLNSSSSGLTVLAEDFPYNSVLQSEINGRTVCGAEILADYNSRTFAICGSSPGNMGAGKILIGYSLGSFSRGMELADNGLTTAQYTILSHGDIVYNSAGDYSGLSIPAIEEKMQQTISFWGKSYYVTALLSGDQDSVVYYTVEESELFLSAHKDTPLLLSIMLLFVLLAFCMHSLINRSVTREVDIIQGGLERIVHQDFTDPLPTDFLQSGFPQLAANINDVSSILNENIKKAYYFELKQKDAQLAELQATFNPHFLYNTLDMLCAKSYANGDLETSELISQLSGLFRGFINVKAFITLKEELAFSNRYFTLLNARYDNQIRLSYNIPRELLEYGIIRNVFQLLIENYFVHGFDTSGEDNYILFSGISVSEEFMDFYVEDNGSGMSSAELDALNHQLQEPIRHGETSYGLKNLNQRIKLFYGPDCGLTVLPGRETGLIVKIHIRKITVEEYEKAKGNSISS